jgi:UTP--glucose-1-phosphate uridylyltransferase
VSEVIAVITAAGLGTRMLPFTKEIPKEMLPIISNGEIKPIIQVIFEQLFSQGIRDFVFVVSRSKRVIEDYFTPDYNFVDYLESVGKVKQAESLKGFYQLLEQSNIAFVNQFEQKGFGHAVLVAKPYVNGDFLVVAPDTLVGDLDLSKLRVNSFLVTVVNDPRPYGVVVVKDGKVIDVEEKPKVPKSNLIIVPYYHFDERIFSALEKVSYEGELQLTYGIKLLLNEGVEFSAVEVKEVYDLGNFNGYVEYLKNLTKKI